MKYQVHTMSRNSKESTHHEAQSDLRKPALYLDKECMQFDQVSSKVSVFFDEYNHEIISIQMDSQNQDIVEVNFQNAINLAWKLSLDLPTKKKVVSIKFNPSHSILAYQINQDTVDFRNVHYQLVEERDVYTLDHNISYKQTVRAKNSMLSGYVWTSDSEIVIVTDNSVEFYHIKRDKQLVEFLKSFPSNTNWFVFRPMDLQHHIPGQNPPEAPVLMVSTSSAGSIIQPYKFNVKQMIKLTKFEVEGPWQKNNNESGSLLLERSVTISTIYSRTRLLVLQHEMLNKNSTGAQILIYTVDSRSGQTTKTHTLDLNMNGRFAINILDDMIVVHDQPSKTSLLFDIELYQTEKNNLPNHYASIVGPRPMMAQQSDKTKMPEMYSNNWVFFQPNYIVDAKRGLLWKLGIDLKEMIDSIKDRDVLLDFLALRQKAKFHIIKKCRSTALESLRLSTLGLASEDNINPLEEMSTFFEKLSHMTISENDNLSKSLSLQPMTLSSPTHSSPRNSTKDRLPFKASSTISNYKVKIDQLDVYHGVLQQFDDDDKYKTPDCVQFISSLILEYIFSIKRQHKLVDYAIYKQLIDCLVIGQQFYQLHQFIIAKVFTDSKQLSCLLLSLSSIFPESVQIGLDMLSRLSTANEEIVDVLISQNQLMRALNFLESNGNVDTVSSRQFFANALEFGDPNMFYNVFRYFEYRNLRLRGSPAFVEGEQCEQYVEQFKKMFGPKSLLLCDL